MKPEDFLKGGSVKVVSANDFASGGFKIVDQNAKPEVKKDLLQKATDILTSIFPGKQVGQAIGTLAGAGIAKLKGNYDQYDLSAPSPLQVGADIAQGALSVAAPNVGNGASAIGRIGANAALGAGIGATNSLAQGDTFKQAGKQALVGGAIGGGTSAAVESVKAFVQTMPKWLTKTALPKLDNKNIPNTLEKIKIGSLDTLKTQSKNSILSHESNIQSLLSTAEHATPEYTPASLIGDTLKDFPNSEYTPDDIIQNAKSLAPKVSKLITKFEQGTANLQEINTIRKEVDQATQSVYTKLSRPPESKMLGASFAGSLREFVKTAEPKTVPIFEEYAKDIGLNKAIQVAIKKGEQKVRLTDIGAGIAGFSYGGWKGALKAILAERLLLNPSAQLGAAKILNAGNKVALPIGKAVVQGGKAPLIKAVSNR